MRTSLFGVGHGSVASPARFLAVGVASALLAVLPACRDGKGSGQVMARVNGVEITVHQVSNELARRGAPNDDKNTRRALDALVDQQLLVEQATDARLDRNPQVLQALEHARRQILSQAYLEHSVSVPRPTADEAKNFYVQYPALFQNRRIYTFRDYLVDRTLLTDALREKLDDPRTRDDLAGTLKTANVSYREASSVRGPEQLPLDMLPRIAAMKKGEFSVLLTDNTAVLMQLADFREQPVALEKATPYIEQYLMNARKKQSVESRIAELRASAKIAYLVPVPDGQGETRPLTTPRPVATTPAAPGTTGAGADDDSIRKGLRGLGGK